MSKVAAQTSFTVRFLVASTITGAVSTALATVIAKCIMDATYSGISGLVLLFMPLRFPIAVLLCAVILAILHYSFKDRLRLAYGSIVATLVTSIVLVIF